LLLTILGEKVAVEKVDILFYILPAILLFISKNDGLKLACASFVRSIISLVVSMTKSSRETEQLLPV